MRKTVTGWFFTVTGILACPCHLVITLPLAVAVLSGTALGGWMATHEGAIATGATIYFVGAVVVGFTLLSMRRSQQAGSTCAVPQEHSAAPEAQWPVNTSRRPGASTPARVGDTLDCCHPAQPLPNRRDLAPSHALLVAYSTSRAKTMSSVDPAEPPAGTGARAGGSV